jgi:hypothetical protein
MEKRKIIGSEGTGPGNAEHERGRETPQDDCRCKEASRMTPRELLKLMIGDLTFWKKADKE